MEHAEFTVIYDSRVLASGARGAWGFSCLVDADRVRVCLMQVAAQRYCSIMLELLELTSELMPL